MTTFSYNPFAPRNVSEYPKCFIAMPMTVSEKDMERFGDKNHWGFIQKKLIEPALIKAEYNPVGPAAHGSDLILSHIFQNLVTSPLAVIDLSSHNPNVFLELGIRISANMPMVLVHNGLDKIPFDINQINIHRYSSNLNSSNIEGLEKEIDELSETIKATINKNAETNILWDKMGVENDPYARLIRSLPGAGYKAEEGGLYDIANRVKQESNNIIRDFSIEKNICGLFLVIFKPGEKLNDEMTSYVESQFGYYVNTRILFDYSDLL